MSGNQRRAPATVLAGYFPTYGSAADCEQAEERGGFDCPYRVDCFPCPCRVCVSFAVDRWFGLLPRSACSSIRIRCFGRRLAIGADGDRLVRGAAAGFLYGLGAIFFAGALVIFFAGSARYLLPMAAPLRSLSRTNADG